MKNLATAFLMSAIGLSATMSSAQCSLDLGPDTAYVCMGQCVPLNVGGTWLAIDWNNGQTGSNICTSAGGWNVVIVTDIGFCTASDSVFIYPVIGNVSATEELLCLGDSASISVASTGLMHPMGSNFQLTYVPDGNGASYSVAINVSDQPPGATYNAATDDLQICLNIEHSFLGDLEMKIICPNGQEAILKEFPGGGSTYLGGAIDNNSGPGTGVDYCFSNNATWGTMVVENTNGNWVTAGTPPSSSLAGGVYAPYQSLSLLNGCPLNGTWTLEVLDNQSIDDGYVTFWGLGMYLASTQATYLWSTGSTDQSIVVSPQQTTAYSVEISTDLFTCTAVQEIEVYSVPTVSFSMNPSDCNLGNGWLDVLLQFGDTLFIYDLLGIEVGPNGLDPGLYDVVLTNQYGCSVDTTLEVALDVDSMDMVYGATIVFPGDQYTYTVGYSACLTYQWTIVNGTILSGQGTHMVTVSWNQGVSGTISVSVQETREFSASLTLEVLMFNGVGEHGQQSLEVFPNPAHGGVYVNLPQQATSYSLIATDGRVLAQGTFVPNSVGKQWISFPAAAAGIVEVVIATPDGPRRGRVTVVE